MGVSCSLVTEGSWIHVREDRKNWKILSATFLEALPWYRQFGSKGFGMFSEGEGAWKAQCLASILSCALIQCFWVIYQPAWVSNLTLYWCITRKFNQILRFKVHRRGSGTDMKPEIVSLNQYNTRIWMSEDYLRIIWDIYAFSTFAPHSEILQRYVGVSSWHFTHTLLLLYAER